MRNVKLFLLVILSGLFFWSCSGNKSTNPVVISPGTGSYSLFVTAEIDGFDVGGGLFQTDILVVVRDSFNLPVTNATVTLNHSVLGNLTLAHDNANPGQYPRTINNYYSGTYTLNVVRGTDNISNARMFAPDIHAMVFPTTSDTLKNDSSFTVIWNRAYVAGVAEVETRDFASGLTDDDESLVVPASFNPRNDQRVRIWRRNTVSLTGGRPGSFFAAEIRNSVEPILVQ